MRIGFVSIYSWRPHVEHLHYLASLVRESGHEVDFLSCDADLPTCYTRELRNVRPGWQECLICRAGGIRSYESSNISSIGSLSKSPILLPKDIEGWALSSASSLGRFESEADFASPAFYEIANRLRPVVNITYTAASNWINARHLDAIVVFNGRMDSTRAIFEAAKNQGIPVASLERTWFGDGLQILPEESCLGLKSVDRLVSEWSTKALTANQAKKAASYIASRFLRRNQNEWRAYNVTADIKAWPASGRKKILLVPGSLNEIWSYPEWGSDWQHPLDAYDALIKHFSLDPSDLVLRAHPNWGEKIGKSDGQMAERYYSEWASRRGILVIPSTASFSTIGLIQQADAIVVASGSAALEAGALGKQVIGIAGANYQMAGIREAACTESQLKSLILRVNLPEDEQKKIAARIRRNTLRFAYTITHRLPQYVDYVKCITPTKYSYKEGADGNRLIQMLKTGELMADDLEYAQSEQEETTILDLMGQLRWMDLIGNEEDSGVGKSIRRRFPFATLDKIRNFLPHGDR